MHPSALQNGKQFFQSYGPYFQNQQEVKVIDIGAQDINGSLRDVCPKAFNYIGVDFAVGKGVDVVLENPYELPFEDSSVDIVVSSSCFEHSEMFWLLFLEILRILKPHGLFYLNAPSNGSFHQYPVDCWRFYPDSGKALLKWAKHSGLQPELLESFVSHQVINPWNDFVGVFVKNETFSANYPVRILDNRSDVENCYRYGVDEIGFFAASTEDLRKRAAMGHKIKSLESSLKDD